MQNETFKPQTAQQRTTEHRSTSGKAEVLCWTCKFGMLPDFSSPVSTKQPVPPTATHSPLQCSLVSQILACFPFDVRHVTIHHSSC